MRCYKTGVRGALHDLRSGYPAEHDPDHYEASQARAKALRAIGSDGLVYRSVRHRGGECVPAFYPDLVAAHIQTRHYQYVRYGACISAVLERSDERRVGKACVRTGRSCGWPWIQKQKKK